MFANTVQNYSQCDGLMVSMFEIYLYVSLKKYLEAIAAKKIQGLKIQLAHTKVCCCHYFTQLIIFSMISISWTKITFWEGWKNTEMETA